jgi:hypothetical protein
VANAVFEAPAKTVHAKAKKRPGQGPRWHANAVIELSARIYNRQPTHTAAQHLQAELNAKW